MLSHTCAWTMSNYDKPKLKKSVKPSPSFYRSAHFAAWLALLHNFQETCQGSAMKAHISTDEHFYRFSQICIFTDEHFLIWAFLQISISTTTYMSIFTDEHFQWWAFPQISIFTDIHRWAFLQMRISTDEHLHIWAFPQTFTDKH